MKLHSHLPCALNIRHVCQWSEQHKDKGSKVALVQMETQHDNEWLLCRVLGWTRKNEITNGRWVMFGLLVGLMTEFATGVDFPNQIKLLVSYLGIYDIYD